MGHEPRQTSFISHGQIIGGGRARGNNCCGSNRRTRAITFGGRPSSGFAFFELRGEGTRPHDSSAKSRPDDDGQLRGHVAECSGSLNDPIIAAGRHNAFWRQFQLAVATGGPRCIGSVRFALPLIISTDQEGGEVIRITSGVKQLPSEYAYGQQDDPAQVKSDSATEAKGLRKLGINMDLAPVLDVATQNSVIGEYDRSYGPSASVDASLGLAAIAGYQHNGVAATAKHVVGLGTTTTDPETTLPHLNLSGTQLTNQLAPFKAAAHAGVDGIMVTHVVLDGVTGQNTPASLSRKVVTGILRDQFNYGGVIMTDSLTMGAVVSHFGLATACRMAVGAGEDMLLVAAGGETQTSLYVECRNAVVSMVKSGSISEKQINASVTRILDLKQKLGLKVSTP